MVRVRLQKNICIVFSGSDQVRACGVMEDQASTRGLDSLYVLQDQCFDPIGLFSRYKDGVLLTSSNQPWNFSRRQRFGLNLLEIRW